MRNKKWMKYTCVGLVVCILLSQVGCSTGKENVNTESDKVVIEKMEPEETHTLSFDVIGGKDVMPVAGYFGPYVSSFSPNAQTHPNFYTDEFMKQIPATGVNLITYIESGTAGERGQTLLEFQSKTRELVTAVVQKIDPKTGNAILTIGHSDATLPKAEQVPDEVLKEGDHIKVYVVDVKETDRGARVMLSRTHPGLVKRLFETEVPEIFDGTIEIKSVSRQAGSRTKIAVYSANPEIDPIGACIGPRGERVNKIVEELAGEKIDIVKYSEDPAQFITEALSPAKVVSVEILSEEPKVCKVSVPEAQLSLAIGKEGQNARLAAKLTGWKIDIKPESGFWGEEE